MLSRRSCRVASFLALVLTTPLFGRGQFWDFLGCSQVDSGQDHVVILLARHDRLFRTIQLRVSGEAVFLDSVVLHFASGNYQDLVVHSRILPYGGGYVIDLPGKRGALEAVELSYYKELWAHNPRLTLYGARFPDRDAETIVREQ